MIITYRNFRLLLAVLVAFLMAGCANQKTPVKSTSGNPIFEGWYADPEGTYMDGTFWVYPTYSAAFEDQVYLDAFSSKDLVSWEKHPRVIDTTRVKWAIKAMWAPAIVQKEKKYYLFFAANDIQAPFREGYDPADKANQVGASASAFQTSRRAPIKITLESR